MAAITSLHHQRRRTRQALLGSNTVRRVLRDRNGRCLCGVCPSCQEEARWERIFNQKFACPEYYLARCQENWSTLARK
ncbi:MAG: hypothetical protein KGN36_05680 [Acidobacteriota bacterium]|nr:hypothetical protein [Acidobacteriota bacterium]